MRIFHQFFSVALVDYVKSTIICFNSKNELQQLFCLRKNLYKEIGGPRSVTSSTKRKRPNKIVLQRRDFITLFQTRQAKMLVPIGVDIVNETIDTYTREVVLYFISMYPEIIFCRFKFFDIFSIRKQ